MRVIGTERDDYEYLSELGQGGMAVVQLARQTVLDRTVALKRLEQRVTDERQRLFVAEALITGALDHPKYCASL